MHRLQRALLAAPLILLMGFTGSHSSLPERDRALHALNRLGFGPRPGDVERVVAIGTERWIEQQLHPEKIPDRAIEARLRQYATLKMSDKEIFDRYYKPILDAKRERLRATKDEAADGGQDEAMQQVRDTRRLPQFVLAELTAQRIIRAAESERQLNEVMVDFWMNHFNVFAGKTLDRVLVTGYERDVIRPLIWSRFEDLLMATAKSPAMLFYLDNASSMAEPDADESMAGRGRVMPKRARGLNENYAREIMELHTLGVDGGYTQKDVTELARVFTGWSINRRDVSFVFQRRSHDIRAKEVLGIRFPAGGGIEEGEKMVRFLARHPATARHIATKLCQRLVSDKPPAALVDRVAKRFLQTDGDLRETVRAVVTSPEFFDRSVYRAKVKSPFEYVVSAVRAIGGKLSDPRALAAQLRTMGEPLYFAQPPTGYSDASEAWVNSGALMNRLNFALALAAGKMPGVAVDVEPFGSDEAAMAAALTGSSLSSSTRATIAKQESKDPTTVAGLILGSPEFQRQ